MNLINAVQVAIKAHQGQFRKGEDRLPYISHPMAVMGLVKEHYNDFIVESQLDDAMIVAVLHDVIEDSDVTAEDLLELGFSDVVVDAVVSVTEEKGDTYLDKVLRAKSNPIGRLVKFCDMIHNMSDGSRKQNKHRQDKYEMGKYILEHA